MITADDPRHGSPAGYTQGCREKCCERAKRADRYRRERLAALGHEFTTSRETTVRKLRALMAMGWTADDIGQRMRPRISGQAVRQFMALKTPCFTEVAARYEQVFDQLEGVLPPDDPWHRRTKNAAARKGWRRPDEWWDIERGLKSQPIEEYRAQFERFDETEVEYALQYHDFSHWLSPVEKSEIVRRWVASGRSEASLCRLTGWREGRYRRPRPQEAS